MAVLLESMRHSGIVPTSPPKSVAKDTIYKGYTIPKVIIPNYVIFYNILYLFFVEKYGYY